MRVMVMRREFDPCWALVPHLCRRIDQFDSVHQINGGNSGLSSMFRQAFASGDSRMLAIAIFEMTDRGPVLSGHAVAGVDMHHGRPMCVVYQYEKDANVRNDVRIDDEVQGYVDNWALSLGMTEVSALAISRSRARHFEKWGYGYTASLITRRIQDGRQGRQDEFDDADDATVVDPNPSAVHGAGAGPQ